MCSVSFGLDLTLENMQGGSEELVKFRKIDEGEAFSFNVVKSDPTDLATIRIFNTPKGSQFQNGVFSWTPGTDQSGMYNVSFSVVDTATQQPSYSTIRIVVADTHFDIPQNQLFEYLFTATDPDGDPVMITVTDLPAGATFVGGQFTPKLFSWRPSKQQKGNHQMTITATDAPVNGGVPKQDISIIYIKVGKPGGPSAKDDQLKKKKPAPKSRGGHSYRVTFKTISLEQMHEFAREWVNG
jgi:hypothetical protein